MAQTDTENLLVCGTNSYKPKCRTYTTTLPEIDASKAATKAATLAAAAKVVKVSEEEDEEGGPFFRMKQEFSGTGICPHDPRHNSTAIFAGE